MKLNGFSKTMLLLLSSSLTLQVSAVGIVDYPDYFLGKDGWVVSKLDYTDITRLRDVRASWPQLHFDFLKSITDSFNKKGIKIIIAIAPQRVNVYPQMLPDDLYAEFIKAPTSYENMLSELAKREINAPDLLTAIKKSQYYSNPAATYYRFEAHWNFYGAAASASAVASTIKTSYPTLTLPTKKFNLSVSAPIDRKETYWLNALPASVQTTVHKDYEIPYKLTKDDTSASLLGDDTPSITLVGTSFSGYGFKNALLYALQADILELSLGGKGMWTPMVQYLQSDNFKKHPPKLLVWEMPEYILLNYPMPTDDEYTVFKSVLNVNKP